MTAFVENKAARGELRIQLFGPSGEAKVDKVVPNLVVDGGLAFIASRMKDATATVMAGMAVGTSNAAVGDTQTALTGELARVALDSTTIVTTNVSNDSVQYVATFAAGTGTGTIEEAGLFDNASSGGTMLCRTLTGTISKGSGDSLVITWKVIIA